MLISCLGADPPDFPFGLGATAIFSRAQQPDPAIQIGATDIGGVVTGPNGPEAGVWVIAETTDLPTKVRTPIVL